MRSPKVMLLFWAVISLFAYPKAFGDPVCPATPLQMPEDKELALDSMVIIQNGAELGSGVIISPDGYVLTAAHVISPARNVAVHLRSGRSLPGKVLHVNPRLDAALLKVSGNGLTCRPLRASLPEAGEPTYGMGLSLDSYRAIYRITEGQITLVQADLLQADANLPIGNSGGPFLDVKGNVVGIISRKAQPSSPAEKEQRTYSYGASAVALQKMLP